MKKLVLTLLLISLAFILIGCQSTKEIHEEAKSRVIEKYSNDTIEYSGPAGDSFGTRDHRFAMSSKLLGTTFIVDVEDWRDNPTIYDTYISVKYNDQASQEFLDGAEQFITTQNWLGTKYRPDFQFYRIENSIDMDANISFDDWYNTLNNTVYMHLTICIDNLDTYDFVTVANDIQKYIQTFKFNPYLSIMWTDERGYAIDEDDYYLITAYYARVDISKESCKWRNKDSNPQEEPYIRTQEQLNSILDIHENKGNTETSTTETPSETENPSNQLFDNIKDHFNENETNKITEPSNNNTSDLTDEMQDKANELLDNLVTMPNFDD